MKLRPTHLLSLSAALALALAAPAAAYATTTAGYGANGDGSSQTAVGLTSDQRLVKFKVNKPSSVKPIGAISGLVGDCWIVGIDYRVQNGLLYGVGDQGGVYTFDGATGTKVSQLTVPMTGTRFGVDFNPAADRLRVVSDTGQNLRHDLNTNTTVEDAALTYPPETTVANGVSGVAYTNNDLDPSTGTTLFDIDTDLDQTAIQSPANAGLLTLTGKLGLDADSGAGFDIYSTLDQAVTTANAGYGALSVEGTYGLYSINLLTGAATAIANFPDSAQVKDLAVQLG